MNYRYRLKQFIVILILSISIPFYLLCYTNTGLKLGIWLFSKQIPWHISSPKGSLAHGVQFDSIRIESDDFTIHIKQLSFKLQLYKLWLGHINIKNLYSPNTIITIDRQPITLHHTGGQLTITPSHIKVQKFQTAYADYHLSISGKFYYHNLIRSTIQLNHNNQPIASATLAGPYQHLTLDSQWFNQIKTHHIISINPSTFSINGHWQTINTPNPQWPTHGQANIVKTADQITLTLNSERSDTSTIQSLNLLIRYKNEILSIEQAQADILNQNILITGQVNLAKEPLQINSTLAIIGSHHQYPYHLQLKSEGIWYQNTFNGDGDISGHIGYQTIHGDTKFNHQQGLNIDHIIIKNQADELKISGTLDHKNIQIHSSGKIYNLGSYFQGVYGGSQWDIHLSGLIENPAIQCLFQLTDINHAYGSIQTCKGQLNAPSGLKNANAQASLTIKQLKLPLLALEQAEMAWQGRLQNHTMTLQASTPILQLITKVHGQWQSKSYQGLIQQLTIQSMDTTWQLQEPHAIILSPNEVNIPELCLITANYPKTCFQWHHQNKQQQCSIQWHLPLNILLAVNPWELSSDCILHGHSTWSIKNHQWQSYQTNLKSEHCHIGFVDTTEQIKLQTLTFNSQLQTNAIESQLQIRSDTNNQIIAKNIWPKKTSKRQIIQSQLDLNCKNLAPLANLSKHISSIQGSLIGQITVSHLLKGLQFDGQINLRDFGLNWPALGLQWKKATLQLNTNQQTWHYRGSLQDRTGQLTLTGDTNWQPELPITNLNIQGTHISLLHTAN